MSIDHFYDGVSAASNQKQQPSVLAAAGSRRHVDVVQHQMISTTTATSTLHQQHHHHHHHNNNHNNHHHHHQHYSLTSVLMELSTSMLNALLHALLVAADTNNEAMGGDGKAESGGGASPNGVTLSAGLSLSTAPPTTLSALAHNGAILPTTSAADATVSGSIGISASTSAAAAATAIMSGNGDAMFRRSFSTPLPTDGAILTTMAAVMIPTVAMTTEPSLSSTSSPTFEEPPVDDWCFDLLVFYRSIAEDDAQARNVLVQLETYSKFSFAVNGIATCLLASFGLLGNILFVSQTFQLHKSRYFSRRLASHLTVLCAWDIALLLCCLLTYGIMASYYGILPFVGIVAYLLYFFQPFASFCVTGTIWQVLAITVERYAAVSRPLEQRTRRARFSLRTICGTIAVGAFLLNMVVVPFERRLTDCYEFTQNGFRIRTMIVQQELVNNQYYAILAHLVPDIVFRAPTPIIAIAILTIQTLRICARRTSATGHRAGSRHNVPFMLTLLNVKFIMCNTLYMFNTILMEVMGYGGKTSNQQTELEMEQYVKSLYLTDFSNLLLAIHSATNWLIFYHWPRFSQRKRRVAKKLSSMTLTSNIASKASSISMSAANGRGIFPADAVNALARHFSAKKYRVANDILVALCANSPQIQRLLIGRVDASADDAEGRTMTTERKRSHPTRKSTSEGGAIVADPAPERHAAVEALLERNDVTVTLREHAVELGDSIEELLNGLANRCYGGASSIFEWRNQCRRVGYRHYKINLYCSAAEWKLVRAILLNAVVDDAPTKASNGDKAVATSSSDAEMVAMTPMQRVMFKAFNCALREMKSGALCAVVDATRCRQLCPQRSLNVGDLWRNSAGSVSIGGGGSCGTTMTAAGGGGTTFGRYGYGIPTPKDATQYQKVASDDNLLLLSSDCYHYRDRFLRQQPLPLQLRNGAGLTRVASEAAARASMNGHIPISTGTDVGSKKSLVPRVVDVPSSFVTGKRLRVRTMSRLIGQLSALFTNKSNHEQRQHTTNAYDCWRKRRQENDESPHPLAEEKRVVAPLLSLSHPQEEGSTYGRSEPLRSGKSVPTTWKSVSHEFRFDSTQISNSSGSGNEPIRFDCLVSESVPDTPQTAIGIVSSTAERMGGVLQQQGTSSEKMQ